MADIGEISAELQQLYDPAPPDSLQHQIGAAAASALIVRNRTVELLDGSEHPDAGALREEIRAITTGLAELATRTGHAHQLQESLAASWTGGSAANTPPVAVTPAQPKAATQDVPEPESTNRAGNEEYPNVLKPEVNYRNPVIQTQLDRPLSEVFSPHAVGSEASQKILAFFQKHSQVTVRDVISSGGMLIVQSTFASRHRDTLRQKIREACPQVPLAEHLSTEDIARISPDLSQVPVQALFSRYTNALRKRVSIADWVDADGKANGYAHTILRLNRPGNAYMLRKIESFVQDYNRAVETHQWE